MNMTPALDDHLYYEKNTLNVPEIAQKLSLQHAILFVTYNCSNTLHKARITCEGQIHWPI
jgi:hypothetical protein